MQDGWGMTSELLFLMDRLRLVPATGCVCVKGGGCIYYIMRSTCPHNMVKSVTFYLVGTFVRSPQYKHQFKKNL